MVKFGRDSKQKDEEIRKEKWDKLKSFPILVSSVLNIKAKQFFDKRL